MEQRALVERQRTEHVILDAFEGAIGTLDGALALGRELHDVASPVSRVATANGQLAGFQHVEQQHAVVGIQMQEVTERLLGHELLLAQMIERHVLLQAHADDVLGGAAVDDAREPSQQHHRSGRRRGLHRPINRNITSRLYVIH